MVSWVILIIAFVQTVTPINLTIQSFSSLSEELEKKVVDRTNELEKVNKEIELFVNSLSHDLKTPLEVTEE